MTTVHEAWRTHEVSNQPQPLADCNLFEGNAAMRDALAHHAPGLDTTALSRLGALAGSAAMQQHARLANTHSPQLKTHDRFGRRIDQVEFHPSYHALMAAACEAGLHGTPWSGGAHAHLQRAAGFMLFTELEPSILCPVSMTYAVTPALRANAAVFAKAIWPSSRLMNTGLFGVTESIHPCCGSGSPRHNV